ncbi:hypothetical protein B0T16DRAFT_462254 [Cercophora newfieldiana]|uniref:Uncharacterized protein n=1 Tax=Cercophora newfieldiana TaxID=92897 RepID=A0AA39XST8_9PEZI|nr:hypothetical protein B0T16DRAFT_462254 [Cercophora newfieldiana]
MVVQARADKVAVIPPVFVELFVTGKGIIGASSIRAPPGQQSSQTCTIVEDANHRYYGNCGEMNALATAVNLGWATLSGTGASRRLVFPRGLAITAYGITNKNMQAGGPLKPCVKRNEWPGCADTLPSASNLKIVSRDDGLGDIQVEGLRAVEWKA